MTDHTLARADEVLTELVELVETARSMPMSASCVIPRERTLDLLDALREVLPPEMIEARRLVAQRDRTLSEAAELAEERVRLATEAAETAVQTAADEAQAARQAAQTEADELLTAARIEAHETVEAALAEQARLVSAATVQQAAIAEAARVSAAAEVTAQQIRDEAEEYGRAVRADADGYAERMTSQSQGYAYTTLADLVEHLQRLVITAENGRNALAPAEPVAADEVFDDAEDTQD